MRSLLALLASFFVLAGCGATAPFPTSSVWPFGDDNIITAARQNSNEVLSIVGFPDQLVISRNTSDLNHSIHWFGAETGAMIGPFDIAFDPNFQ
jgi:hypothetical protein